LSFDLYIVGYFINYNLLV
jgi:hypothetical protein